MMACSSAGSIYTIPSGHSFVDALARGLMERAKGDPLALSASLVLLPTRRACRALAEAFLRQSDGRAMLLPRMMPLGGLDEDELQLTGMGAGAEFDLPPAIDGLKRRLMLTRLILALGDGRGGRAPSPDQAARLAEELAGLLDSVQSELLSFDALAGLVSQDYAEHWQITLDFLKILTEIWPSLLQDEGVLDPIDRRNRLILAQAEQWRRAPPDFPIIIAGETGLFPATIALMKAVRAAPRGMVIVPGLDPNLPTALWEALDAGHPLYAVKTLLDRLQIAPSQVADWTGCGPLNPHRAALASEAMRPAATTEAWRDLPHFDRQAIDGIELVTCETAREEAGAIALIMRETLEHPRKTCALVTPDRALARRVAAELRRWGIEIDDSGGQSLGLTPPGAFLRLTARMIAEQAAPIPLLAALKHPLAAGGLESGRFRALVRRLELLVLRGVRPAAGIAGVRAALAERDADLDGWLADLEAMASAFSRAMMADTCSFADLVRLHMEFAEALATDPVQPGALRLWSGEAGEQAALFAAHLHDAAPLLGEIAPRHYPALLEALMSGLVVRPVWGSHPRLKIWGLLEARLQQADVMILGGLNEGVWPQDAPSDPWMSRPMRADFGLPMPEHKIGLAAHDFLQGFCAPRVVLTRSLKIDGAPSVPCRWLLRLETVMRAGGLLGDEHDWRSDHWRAWHRLLDKPAAIVPVAPPRPCPPVAARPRRLSVTEIETWMRDPYAIYARHILKLKALDPLDDDPSAATYGSLMHKSLELFIRQCDGAVGADGEERFLQIGQEVFAEALSRPAIRAFWWPRLCRLARWIVAQERERRPLIASSYLEIGGSLDINGPYGPFRLVAKADRIDHMTSGTLHIIDYKTGAVPSSKEVNAGYAPQLPLEAAIAKAGGFTGVPSAPLEGLAFWHLRASDETSAIKMIEGDPEQLAAEALEGLRRLIEAFDDQATPYIARPYPKKAPAYSPYGHLARTAEWIAAERDEEGGVQ